MDFRVPGRLLERRTQGLGDHIQLAGRLGRHHHPLAHQTVFLIGHGDLVGHGEDRGRDRSEGGDDRHLRLEDIPRHPPGVPVNRGLGLHHDRVELPEGRLVRLEAQPYEILFDVIRHRLVSFHSSVRAPLVLVAAVERPVHPHQVMDVVSAVEHFVMPPQSRQDRSPQVRGDIVRIDYRLVV